MDKYYLKLNQFLFSFYYKRVPVFFIKWTFVKSIKLLIDNYEHSEFRINGLEQVIKNASTREKEMQTEISNLRLKLKGMPQEQIDKVNKIFGTELKGISREEQNN